MRRYRMGLIQTAEQLRFSYLSIIEGAERMDIDMKWIPPHVPRSASCSDTDSDSGSEDDDSDNAEEVEEEDDVTPEEALLKQVTNNQLVAREVNNFVNDTDEPPPPIPPRAESLHRAGYYNEMYTILKITFLNFYFIFRLRSTSSSCSF